jgi:hypothetical protein
MLPTHAPPTTTHGPPGRLDLSVPLRRILVALVAILVAGAMGGAQADPADVGGQRRTASDDAGAAEL